MQKFMIQLQVQHCEMDALGHVNNAVYLKYLEQAAIAHSEFLGFSLERYRELGGVFVLRRMTIDYRRPAIAGDVLEIMTWVGEMRGSRAIRHYEIHKQGYEQLLVTAEALWIWVKAATMNPKAIPRDLLSAFQNLKATEIS
jgi:acyl-CoA thioester hydrolase